MLESLAIAVRQGPDAQTVNTALLFGSALLVFVLACGVVLYVGATRPSRRSVTVYLAGAGLVAVLWVICGYGFVFGPRLPPGVFRFLGFSGVLGNPVSLIGLGDAWNSAHDLAFALFQGAVAILAITVVAGMLAHRVRLRGWLVFAGVWMLLVYLPVAYAVYNVNDGWAFNAMEVNDLGGVTVVFLSTAAAALAIRLVLGRNSEVGADRPPARGQLVGLLGAVLLWIGGFGLNLGSEGVVGALFGTESLNLFVTPLAAVAGWLIVETIRARRPTVRGTASGVVAGVVAITPACNILTPDWAIVLGLLAGALGALAVTIVRRRGVSGEGQFVAVLLVAGILGMLYIGLFGSGIGWRDNGQPDRLIAQAVVTFAIIGYSFVIALIVGFVIKLTIGLVAAKNSTVGSRSVTAKNGE